MIIQYVHSISWSIHNMGGLLWRHSAVPHTAKQQKHEEQQIHSKHQTRGRYDLRKTKVLDSGKVSSLTIYTAKNTEMVRCKPTQGRMMSQKTLLRLKCSCIS